MITIFELEKTRIRFEETIVSRIKSAGRTITSSDLMIVDEIYTTIVSGLVENILSVIRNKEITYNSFETSNAHDPICDNLHFSIYNSFGVDIRFEQIIDSVSLIETALIEDIGKNIPVIENNSVTILGYSFCPMNSCAIEVRINDSVGYN